MEEGTQSEDIEGYSEHLSDSDDSDFIVDVENIVDEPEVDMKEFFLRIDKYI